MADQGRMVKMWFKKSVEDLKTAQFLLSQKNEDFIEASAFHAQQSAEKAIKGFLVLNKMRFSKTHDLEILINLVSQIDESLAEKLRPAAILTKFAIAYRYPEEAEVPEPLSQVNCQKIYDLANMVFAEIQLRVSK